jgi:hypothetical protein
MRGTTMGHRMASEIRIIILMVVALAAVALMAHHWTAQAAVIHGDTQFTAPAQLQHAQLQQAQLRSVAGSGLRVATGF